jgi:hypothetical protein
VGLDFAEVRLSTSRVLALQQLGNLLQELGAPVTGYPVGLVERL